MEDIQVPKVIQYNMSPMVLNSVYKRPNVAICLVGAENIH